MGGHLTDLINIADRADLLEGAKIKKMAESLKINCFTQYDAEHFLNFCLQSRNDKN